MSLFSWHKNPLSSIEGIDEKDIKFIESDFRSVFSGDDGMRVLTKILTDLCFFRACENPDEVALNNYAKQLLSYFGEWDVGYEDLIVSRLIRS